MGVDPLLELFEAGDPGVELEVLLNLRLAVLASDLRYRGVELRAPRVEALLPFVLKLLQSCPRLVDRLPDRRGRACPALLDAREQAVDLVKQVVVHEFGREADPAHACDIAGELVYQLLVLVEPLAREAPLRPLALEGALLAQLP